MRSLFAFLFVLSSLIPSYALANTRGRLEKRFNQVQNNAADSQIVSPQTSESETKDNTSPHVEHQRRLRIAFWVSVSLAAVGGGGSLLYLYAYRQGQQSILTSKAFKIASFSSFGVGVIAGIATGVAWGIERLKTNLDSLDFS